MKFLTVLFSLTMLTPSMLLASGDGPSNSSINGSLSNKECVDKVAEYFGVVSETQQELSGTQNGKKCKLIVEQKKSGLLDLSLQTEMDNSEFADSLRIYLSPNSNEGLHKFTVTSCKVSNGSLNLEYTTKQTYGWKKSFKIHLNVSEKSVELKQRESGLLLGISTAKESCQF